MAAMTFTPAPVAPLISFDLAALDIRVGTILAVEDIAGSKKLMKLTVSFGSFTRSIVAGIRLERQAPQHLVGTQTLFVLNIPPKVMAGVTSEGMLFDVGYADGLVPCLMIPERTMPDGARAG